MTAESLISKSGPCPLPFHSTCRPWCLGLHSGPALPPARGAGVLELGYLQRASCVSAGRVSAPCAVWVSITLSRLLRQVLFALGSPPTYQLMASNSFQGLRFAQTQTFPPSSSNPFLRFPPFTCATFVQMLIHVRLYLQKTGFLAYASC